MACHVSPTIPNALVAGALHALAVERCGTIQQFVWNLNIAIRNSASVGLG